MYKFPQILRDAEGGSGAAAPAPAAPAEPPAVAPVPSAEATPPVPAPQPPVVPPAQPVVPPAVISRIGELTRKNKELEERIAAQAPPAGGTPPAPAAAGQFDESEVQRRAELIAAQQAWNAQASKVWNDGVAKFQDFDPAIRQITALMGGNIPMTVTQAAIAVGNPEEIIYHLSKDLNEASRIMLLPPAQQGVEVAKFAQKMRAAAAPSVSSAPAPIVPQVGGGGTVQPDGLDDKLGIDEWMARREKQVASKGRR